MFQCYMFSALYKRIHSTTCNIICIIMFCLFLKFLVIILILTRIRSHKFGQYSLHYFCLIRDLKPRNIMISQTGTAKICDFGISRIKEHTYLTTENLDRGTAPYMAPECFSRDCGLTEKCDIYSFGVVLYECVTGLMPWAECRDPFVIAYQVGALKRRPTFPESLSIPDPLKTLIETCWHANPAQRPTSSDVLHVLCCVQSQLENN